MSWNVAIGAGDVAGLIRTLVAEERRANRPEPDFVLLLQDAYRASAASRDPRAQHGTRKDVLSLAADLRLNAVYVPSMRNGSGTRGAPENDRGNAILSTLPLHDITGIELPFVRQRRVAIAATVDAHGSRLTVLSVHLSPRSRLLHGWMFAGPFSRDRQAAAIVEALPSLRITGPLIVGGDFNTIGGEGEPAIRRMEQHLAKVRCGSPITQKWGFTLDHMFASTPSVLIDCERLRNRYGSDHHPLVARIR